MHFSGAQYRKLQTVATIRYSFVRYEIGFVRIVDFFYILYCFLKNLQVIYFEPNLSSTIYPPLPILQNLSFRIYPPLPILYYLSSSGFCMGVKLFLKCGWGDGLYGSKSIFRFSLIFYFLGNCFYGGEPCSAQCPLIRCRWVYKGKKIWDFSWLLVASRYFIVLIWAIDRCKLLNITATELCLVVISPVQTAGFLLLYYWRSSRRYL